MRFIGKTVVVTGAARGIGRATVQRFHEEGATVCAIDRQALSETSLTGLRAERGHYIQADLSVETDLSRIDAYFQQQNVDVLINNAGITRDATIGKLQHEDWQSVININLTAVFRMAQMAARSMRSHKAGGVILNAASVVAHYGNFGQANYVAAKAGVIGLTKTLAKELGKHQIRVNAVAPGFIQTPMVEAVPEHLVQQMKQKTPLGRLGRDSEVASLYAFLASDEAQYITGSTINIDGGLILG